MDSGTPERPRAAEADGINGARKADAHLLVRKPWIGCTVMLIALTLVFTFMGYAVEILRATNSLLPNLFVVTMYYAIAFVLLVRRRRFAGAGRELGGGLLGVIMGIVIPALAIGFSRPMALGDGSIIYPGEVIVIWMPVFVASVCFCAFFHPLAVYSAHGN